MGETRFRYYKGVVNEGGIPPRITHNIDQFAWYRDVKQRNLGNDYNPDNKEQLLSAVRFQLPTD